VPETTDQPTRDEQSKPASKPFDPRTHLRRMNVRGRDVDYLDVKWRLVWLRSDHPDAHITTELVSHDGKLAVFHAEVVLPSGGRASGYGSETARDFPDYIEKAETKAIGRALLALGYGTQFALDYEMGDDQSEDAPVQAASRTVTPPERPAEQTRVRVVPPTMMEPEPESEEEAEPADGPADEQPTNVRPIREEAPSGGREAFEPADYSWNEFWRWARSLGYTSRSELADLLGLNLGEMTPHEVRRQLLAYRDEHGIE
jgi:hypothetical protein